LLKDFFRKPKYVTIRPDSTVGLKEKPVESRGEGQGLWQKCPECREILYFRDLESNFKVCGKCGYHYRLTAHERTAQILDENSFVEWDKDYRGGNPLDFSGYEEKVQKAIADTGLGEGILTGQGTIDGLPVAIGVMDGRFIMGSMGAAVGEKIARAAEQALEKRIPLILFTASGGARMQEGIISLMQMAKTSAALAKLGEAGVPYFTVLTDPTTGGVTASFAMLGDVIIAEPGALIAFAGPRVIEQTIRQKLPDGFQRSEFLMDHGFVDILCTRTELRATLSHLVALHGQGGGN
jgi:acetyl-CoA carboxylase carboxyl transferase subunit beta